MGVYGDAYLNLFFIKNWKYLVDILFFYIMYSIQTHHICKKEVYVKTFEIIIC